jgi:outer membrane protein
MKTYVLTAALACLLCLPATLHALSPVDIEAAAGVWRPSPSGYVSYESDDRFDLEDVLNYDDETAFTGRLKIGLPFPVPSIYLMASSLRFKETGRTNSFSRFGDVIIVPGIAFDSKLSVDQYDIGLYYQFPLLKTATLNRLNVELGINAKIIDAKAEIVQETFAPLLVIRETEKDTLVAPMVYLGIQFRPIERLTMEGEFRGLSWRESNFYSLIGRLKVNAWGPLFIAGGYRYDTGDSTEFAFDFDVDFQGPFFETGLQF